VPRRTTIGRDGTFRTEALLERGDQIVGAEALARDVLADVQHARRRGLGREHHVERRDAVDLGGRNHQALRDVRQRRRADVPDAILHGPQHGQQQVPILAGLVAAFGDAGVGKRVALAAVPARERRAEELVHGLLLDLGRGNVEELDVH
jgi:hypothetical protein